MYPVLFRIGSIPVHTYYILWTVALCFCLEWTRRRAEGAYGMPPALVSKVLFWSFIGMFVGARLGGYVDFWKVYAEDPMRILKIWEGALSSTTGFLGAGLTAIFLLRREGWPVWPLAEAASLPAAALLVIGRWGCFFNGCCYGVVTGHRWGVHFPFDGPGVSRHPTQLYYSFGAALIFLALFLGERVWPPVERRARSGALLWPLFMVLYGGMRFFVDFLRYGDRVMGLRTGQIVGFGVALAGLIWLVAVDVAFRRRGRLTD
ncbi:MAG: prolipoprotein diacylglyceryl transferase [Synergistaceae bacterium]|nr:prolipoprotein diacylglyceryl transferase [Synergistaceae bacterium]